jgi:hypothetical protein
LALTLGLPELGDPFGCGCEVDALACQACSEAQRGSEVCLSGAGRVRVELLTLLMFCLRGCGWWTRRVSCVMSSWRCSAGAQKMVRPP